MPEHINRQTLLSLEPRASMVPHEIVQKAMSSAPHLNQIKAYNRKTADFQK